jgi:CHAT domain-containing protein
MTRPSIRFLRRVLLCVLSIICSISLNMSAAAGNDANNLTQQGFQQLYAGQSQAAVQSWQRTENLYRQHDDPIGVAGSLINQSIGYQALGKQLLACEAVSQAMQLHDICQQASAEAIDAESLRQQLNQLPPSTINHLGLKALGDVLRQLRQFDAAKVLLEAAIAQDSSPDAWLSLGQLNADNAAFEEARSAYQQAIAKSNNVKSTMLGRIGILEIDAPNLTGNEIEQRLRQLSFNNFPGIQQAQAHLQLAQFLINHDHADNAAQQAQAALSLGIQDTHTQANALVILAEAQDNIGVNCLTAANRAQYLAQSIQAWEIDYRASALLGKTSQTAGQLATATIHYRQAISSLRSMRQDLRGSPAGMQFQLHEAAEPVYHAYLNLLFEQNLDDEAIAVSRNRQLDELETGWDEPVPDWQSIDQMVATTDNYFIFVLEGTNKNRVIIRSRNQRYSYSIDARQLATVLENITITVEREDLIRVDPAVIVNYGKVLYQLLLAPAARTGHLPINGNLTFILDPTLQELPVDFLHDGKDYLLTRYSFNLGMGGPMQQPQALQPGQIKAVLAGIDTVAPSFSDQLPTLMTSVEELQSISPPLNGKILANQDFTIAKLTQEIAEQQPDILHLSTHGRFSADPQATGIFAWDKPITMAPLKRLIQTKQQNGPLNLLVLSACETAKGDRRSMLGLAGVAAQAGARSTLASRWLADEYATMQLMNKFYAGLTRGTPKAEALRQAKLELMRSQDFNHPFFWGGFTLLGSWI